jgi:CspA family cold shock protein
VFSPRPPHEGRGQGFTVFRWGREQHAHHWQGQVVQRRGYGFITPNGGENDCFVHYSAIEGSGFRSLKEGDTVEFEMVDGQKGPSAQNVTKIEA